MVHAEGELEVMMLERQQGIAQLAVTSFDNILGEQQQPSIQLATNAGGASGGYLDFIFRQAARSFFKQEVVEVAYEYASRTKRGQSEDFLEATLVVDGVPVLNFAKVGCLHCFPSFISFPFLFLPQGSGETLNLPWNVPLFWKSGWLLLIGEELTFFCVSWPGLWF